MKPICVSCGSLLDIGTVYCPFCGAEQPQEDTGNRPQKKERNKKSVPIMEPKAHLPRPSEDAILIRREDDDDDEVVLPEENINQSEPVKRREATIVTEKPSTIIPKKTEIKTEDLMPEEPKAENSANISDEKKSGSIFSKKIREAEAEKKRIYIETHDERTGCLNDSVYLEDMQKGSVSDKCVIAAGATNYIATINKSGQETANLYLKCVGEALQQTFGDDNVYFLGGEDFRVILTGIKETEVSERAKLFYKLIDKKSREQTTHINMPVALGITFGAEGEDAASIEERASKSMQDNTQKIKNMYRPNDDGYYDDVKVEYEKLKKQYIKKDMSAVVKNLILIGAGTIALVVLRMFI